MKPHPARTREIGRTDLMRYRITKNTTATPGKAGQADSKDFVEVRLPKGMKWPRPPRSPFVDPHGVRRESGGWATFISEGAHKGADGKWEAYHARPDHCQCVKCGCLYGYLEHRASVRGVGRICDDCIGDDSHRKAQAIAKVYGVDVGYAGSLPIQDRLKGMEPTLLEWACQQMARESGRDYLWPLSSADRASAQRWLGEKKGMRTAYQRTVGERRFSKARKP